MSTRTFLLLLAVLLTLGTFGMGETPKETPTTEPPAATDMLQHLKAPERFGQLMMVTATGRNSPSMDDFAYMEKCPPGGVIIQQILRPGDAVSYVNKLRRLELGTGIPLWIGANLYRLGQRDRGAASAFPQVPSMLSVAAAHDERLTQLVAVTIADQMRAMGFDLHVGPSLELAPDLPQAPGSMHTFGSDPAQTGEIGVQMLTVFQEKGLLPMITGFPGGGLNRTARSAAVLLTPSPLLPETELVPYELAIRAGAQLVLVGNTLVPTLDSLGRPASLSPDVMRGLLRERLKFSGVIVAGPMDGPEVANLYDPADAAVATLEAGADMLYWNQAGGAVLKAVMRIEEAVKSGRLREEALMAALERVLVLKTAQRAQRLAPRNEEHLNKLSSKHDYRDACQEVERRAITLIRNDGGVLPLDKEASAPLLITGTVGVSELRTALERRVKPLAEQRITTGIHVGAIEDFEIKRIKDHIEGVRTAVCILTNEEQPEGQAALIREMQIKGARVVLVLLGYPKHLPQLAHADAVLLAYCDPFALGWTISALADILMGESPVAITGPAQTLGLAVGQTHPFTVRGLLRSPGGRLPVRLSEELPAGLALSYDAAAMIKKVEWDFGDGTRAKDLDAPHAFAAPGKYAVTAIVTDRNKNTATARWEADVRP